MKYVYVTSPLNLLSRRGDLPSLRSKVSNVVFYFVGWFIPSLLTKVVQKYENMSTLPF